MILTEYIEKNYSATEGRKKEPLRTLCKIFKVSPESMRLLARGESHPSRKLAIEIEKTTRGEVSRFEAVFPEYFVKKKAEDERKQELKDAFERSQRGLGSTIEARTSVRA